MNWKVNTDSGVAVAVDYFWQPMSTCPVAATVQLLGGGGVACHGQWDGKDTFWRGWAPLPKKPDWMKG